MSVESYPSVVERLATLEAKQAAIESNQEQILGKLDELLGLRDKGVGAFWVISALTGTGIIGIIVTALDWLKGHH